MNQQQTAVTYPGAVPSKPACVGCNKSVQPTDVRKKPTPPQGSYAAPMPAPTPNAAYYSQPPQASAATEVACLEDALAKAEAEKAALLLEQERLRAEQARLKSEQNKMAEKIKKEKACDEVKDWNAVEGSTLRGLLTDWGDQVGWRVVWNMDRDYTLEAGAVFRGRFTDVSAALLRSFARARPAPKGVFYNGNKVLVISTREDENAE